MSKPTKSQKKLPQLERFFLMMWGRNNGVDMWALLEQLTLKKLPSEEVAQILFEEEEAEEEILQLFNFLYEGRTELSWLIKDVHIHELDPAEAVSEVRDYVKRFAKK